MIRKIETKNASNLKKEVEDIKALLILLLQKMKVDNITIGKAIGMSPGRVSQLVDKIKYKRK